MTQIMLALARHEEGDRPAADGLRILQLLAALKVPRTLCELQARLRDALAVWRPVEEPRRIEHACVRDHGLMINLDLEGAEDAAALRVIMKSWMDRAAPPILWAFRRLFDHLSLHIGRDVLLRLAGHDLAEVHRDLNACWITLLADV